MKSDKSNKSPIETNPLATARMEQIERELRAWATKRIEFSFNPQGTHLFSMLELAYSYAKRCVNFADAIRALISDDRIVPATVVARALIETVAMGCLYLHDMERLIASKDLERLEARLMRYYAGRRDAKTQPVHVLDAMRHLEKIDATYVAYLDKKYGMFTRLINELKAANADIEGKSFGEMISAMKNYDELSEICHPNGTGTQYLFPDESNETVEVAQVRDRFRFASLTAIWQCHHLLAQLEMSAELSERYRAAFLAAK
jgi:hypothetical protein